MEGKIEDKKVQLEKAKTTLDLIPTQHGYKNALEVTKAMKTAKTELKEVQLAPKAWDAPKPEPEKMYLRIPAVLSYPQSSLPFLSALFGGTISFSLPTDLFPDLRLLSQWHRSSVPAFSSY